MKHKWYHNGTGIKWIQLFQIEILWCCLVKSEWGLDLRHNAILLGRASIRYMSQNDNKQIGVSK
jgi:hypothetical protein